MFKYNTLFFFLMKANFKINSDEKINETEVVPSNQFQHDIDDKEFEDFMVKNGAAGSFMVFRDGKEKTREMGLDEL